jgi:hypothetical protein
VTIFTGDFSCGGLIARFSDVISVFESEVFSAICLYKSS